MIARAPKSLIAARVRIRAPRVVATGGPLPGTEITFNPNTATVTPAGKKPLKLTKVTSGHRYQLRWMPEKLDPR